MTACSEFSSQCLTCLFSVICCLRQTAQEVGNVSLSGFDLSSFYSPQNVLVVLPYTICGYKGTVGFLKEGGDIWNRPRSVCKGIQNALFILPAPSHFSNYSLSTLISARNNNPLTFIKCLQILKKFFHTPFTFPNSKVKIKIVLLLFKYI